MKIVNPVRIDRISFDDGSFAEFQRSTIMSERGRELCIDYLKLIMKKVTYQFEYQQEQEALEKMLLKQE